MLQREVARNMVALPGHMTLLSVSVQLYGQPRIVSYVLPNAFRPPPKVTSAIVRIDVYPEPAVDNDRVEGFFRIVKAGFSAPRKQLRNALMNGLTIGADSAHTILSNAGIDPSRRAQTLALQEWSNLYRSYRHTT